MDEAWVKITKNRYCSDYYTYSTLTWFTNPTMHQPYIIYTCMRISVTIWCIVRHLSNALWDLWDGSIRTLYFLKRCTHETSKQFNHQSTLIKGAVRNITTTNQHMWPAAIGKGKTNWILLTLSILILTNLLWLKCVEHCPLQLHHINVEASQIACNSTVCFTDYSGSGYIYIYMCVCVYSMHHRTCHFVLFCFVQLGSLLLTWFNFNPSMNT